LVPKITSIINLKSYTITPVQRPVDQPRGKAAPISNRPETNGLDSVGQTDLGQVFIKKRFQISEAKKGSTKAAWKKWDSWCSGNQVDPFRCPIEYI